MFDELKLVGMINVSPRGFAVMQRIKALDERSSLCCFDPDFMQGLKAHRQGWRLVGRLCQLLAPQPGLSGPEQRGGALHQAGLSFGIPLPISVGVAGPARIAGHDQTAVPSVVQHVDADRRDQPRWGCHIGCAANKRKCGQCQDNRKIHCSMLIEARGLSNPVKQTASARK